MAEGPEEEITAMEEPQGELAQSKPVEETPAEEAQPGSPARVRTPESGLTGATDPHEENITVPVGERVQLNRHEAEGIQAVTVASPLEED